MLMAHSHIKQTGTKMIPLSIQTELVTLHADSMMQY